MHSDTNVNLRAARNLVNTVHATREQQRSAMATLERNLARTERTLLRWETHGWALAALAAVAAEAVILIPLWFHLHHGGGNPEGVKAGLLTLFIGGAPLLAGLLTVDGVRRRIDAADLQVARAYQRREQLQHLIARLNITVKESEQELAAREQAAA
ncbi:hypothetical protein ACWGJ9_11680 [Curtobacterium citreum]